MTVLSYALHVDTYFVNPRALNAPGPLPFGAALVGRIGGLVINSAMNAIAVEGVERTLKVGQAASANIRFD